MRSIVNALTRLFLMMIVFITIIASPLSGFGCRTLSPFRDLTELPCQSLSQEISQMTQSNYLDLFTVAFYGTNGVYQTYSIDSFTILAPIEFSPSLETPPPKPFRFA